MIQCITQASVVVGSARAVKLVAVVDGTINIGDPSGLFIAAGGGAAFASTADVQCCVINSAVYLTDGITVKKLDCSTGSVSTFAPAGMPAGCRLIANWRGRLVLARQDATPHLWYMSRLADETDWDFVATDPAAAVAGNNSTAGTIGDVITALMVASDDVLYFGGDHTLWRMVGDPGAGGQIVPCSEQIGVVGPRAWTQSETGLIYFVSPQGLSQLAGGITKEISDPRVADYFKDVSKTEQYITLAWDRDRGALWLFRQEIDGSTSTHLFYDEATDSFWPQKFANTDMRPQCAMMYDGDGPDDRRFILGGYTDKLYYLNEDSVDDAGTAISSYVFIGPHFPSGVQGEGRAVRLDVTIGEYPQHASLPVAAFWSLLAGRDPYEAYAHPVQTLTSSWQVSGASSDLGRQTPLCVSMRGRSFFLKVYDFSASSTWVYDAASMDYQPAGRSR